MLTFFCNGDVELHELKLLFDQYAKGGLSDKQFRDLAYGIVDTIITRDQELASAQEKGMHFAMRPIRRMARMMNKMRNKFKQ